MIRMRRSGSIEVDSSVKGLFLEDQSEEETSRNTGIKEESALNPWVLKCHRTQLQELVTKIHANNSEPSILLLKYKIKRVSINIIEIQYLRYFLQSLMQ
jgi:hypothetical protein